MRLRLSVGILAGVVCLVAACGGGSESSADASSAAASAQVTLSAVPEPLKLSENDVEHWIAAAGELKALGVGLQEKQGDSPTDLTATMISWHTNREVMAVLRKHEFDLPRFHRVTYSVMMAAAADGMSQQSGEMEKAKVQLEAMKATMSKEMYEMMKKQQDQAMELTKQVMNQPEGNVELVRRYRERIEAIAK
jgi:hypothetical protein